MISGVGHLKVSKNLFERLKLILNLFLKLNFFIILRLNNVPFFKMFQKLKICFIFNNVLTFPMQKSEIKFLFHFLLRSKNHLKSVPRQKIDFNQVTTKMCATTEREVWVWAMKWVNWSSIERYINTLEMSCAQIIIILNIFHFRVLSIVTFALVTATSRIKRVHTGIFLKNSRSIAARSVLKRIAANRRRKVHWIKLKNFLFPFLYASRAVGSAGREKFLI